MSRHITPDGKKLVTVIPGDGIGPECVESAVRIVEATGAPIAWEERHAGESVFKQGIASGVPADTIESVHKTRCVLKGPLGTPVGYGEKSANVTLRKLFETYANVRPVRELPGVRTPYSGRGIDLVVVRENVEDLYAGIEHMQTPGVAQCLKLISRKGCEKIARFAFEFARSEGRKSVACATKSNIMKLTEGMLKRTIEEVAKDYPDIESWHVIIDNCAHQLVKRPEQFDVIVTTNMNGDIISDLTSALIGGLGFAPSANIGNEVAIFEAVHGSAPKYAGKNVINPTAVIGSDKGCSTTDYTNEIIRNLGRRPSQWKVRDYRPIKLPQVSADPVSVRPASRRTLGMDIFIEWPGSPDALGKQLEAILESSPVKLKMISNRGTKVYPPTGAITDCVDQFRCRLVAREAAADLTNAQLQSVIAEVGAHLNWAHVEKLQEFDGSEGFTKAQGED